MHIINPVIEKVGASFCKLSFAVSEETFGAMLSEKLFSSNEELFLSTLPARPYQEIIITIIGLTEKYSGDEKEVSIEAGDWTFVSARINGVVYETFFNLLDWNDPASSYTDAMIRFTARKAAGEYGGEAFGAGAVEKMIRQMVSGTQNNTLSQPADMAAVAGELLRSFKESSSGPAVSVRGQVEQYLTNQGIPIDFSEASFYFYVNYEGNGWSVELNLEPEENIITAYSSIAYPLPADTGELLSKLNEINLSIGYGNYEYADSLERLYFKNAIPVLDNRVNPDMLGDMIAHNFKQMAGMIAIADRLLA